MLVLIDTDVLIDVALDREPHVEHSGLLLDNLTVESFRPSRPIWKTQNFQVIENKCLMEMGGKAS